MVQKMKSSNESGFTLIELMIVIAIIGILAAIAIPNFISYRDKGFCSAAEKDAGTVAAALADYYSDANAVGQPATAEDLNLTLSSSSNGQNTAAITHAADNGPIEIAITDVSGRCPNGSTYTIVMGGASGAWDGGAAAEGGEAAPAE